MGYPLIAVHEQQSRRTGDDPRCEFVGHGALAGMFPTHQQSLDDGWIAGGKRALIIEVLTIALRQFNPAALTLRLDETLSFSHLRRRPHPLLPLPSNAVRAHTSRTHAGS